VDVFQIREQLVSDYSSFTSSFVESREPRIKALLDQRDDNGSQWPEPWLSLIPNFAAGGIVDELVSQGLLHPETARIFRVKESKDDTGLDKPISFHRHQREAIEAAQSGVGTGSSMNYRSVVAELLVPIQGFRGRQEL